MKAGIVTIMGVLLVLCIAPSCSNNGVFADCSEAKMNSMVCYVGIDDTIDDEGRVVAFCKEGDCEYSLDRYKEALASGALKYPNRLECNSVLLEKGWRLAHKEECETKLHAAWYRHIINDVRQNYKNDHGQDAKACEIIYGKEWCMQPHNIDAVPDEVLFKAREYAEEKFKNKQAPSGRAKEQRMYLLKYFYDTEHK